MKNTDFCVVSLHDRCQLGRIFCSSTGKRPQSGFWGRPLSGPMSPQFSLSFYPGSAPLCVLELYHKTSRLWLGEYQDAPGEQGIRHRLPDLFSLGLRTQRFWDSREGIQDPCLDWKSVKYFGGCFKATTGVTEVKSSSNCLRGLLTFLPILPS